MNQNAVTSLMLKRQCLLQNAVDHETYEQLFRLMQPVQPVFWCCPGEPPRLVHRTTLNDTAWNFQKRSDRTLIKGRFQKGSIAYIHADELELFACVYRKSMDKMSMMEQLIFETVQREGPLTIHVIKEMTGLLVKQITPILHKLQQAFLVFEDQADNEWDRGWYLFETEFPNVNPVSYTRTEAIKALILRFMHLHVMVSIHMIQSFYAISLKDIQAALQQLEQEMSIQCMELNHEPFWIRQEDIPILEEGQYALLSPSVFVLHRNDFLAKSSEFWLKEQFHSDTYDTLQYILIDGRFRGAVLGKFRQGPYDVEDITLILPEDEILRRRDKILRAVYEVNGLDNPIQRYGGKPL